MGNVSSFNMKQSKDFNIWHNADIRPNYAIGGGIEFSLNGYEALKLKNEIIQKAQEAYTKRTGQKFQAKSYEWSAVVNLKPTSSMEDLTKLAKYFKDKFGFQCYQMAIHRDEGHFNDQGEKVINHHAHLEFITLDEKTGINRQREIKPSILRQIQSEVAEILQMERGQDKRVSKRERIEPRKYAQMKEAEKENIKKAKQEAKAHNIELQRQKLKDELARELGQNYLSKKEAKEFVENFKKKCIGIGLPKEFFRELSDKKKSLKEAIKEELELFCDDLLEAYKAKSKEAQDNKENLEYREIRIKELNEENENLRESDTIANVDKIKKENISLKTKINEVEKERNNLKAENQALKAEKEKNKAYPIQNDLNANLTPQNDFKELSKENKELKSKIKELKIENGMLKRIIFAFAKAYEGSIIYSVMGKMKTKFKSWLALDKNTKKSKEIKQAMSKDQLTKTIQTLRQDLSNSKSQAKYQGFSR